MKKQRNKKDPIERLKNKIKRVKSCWVYQGSLLKGGYGQFWLNGTNVLAHRFSYECAFGPIPEGLTIDHLCRNRACVNPYHLEAVTLWENTFRGENFIAQNAKKMHCKNGHKFTKENTYKHSGKRMCRKCRYKNHRKWVLKNA